MQKTIIILNKIQNTTEMTENWTLMIVNFGIFVF